MAKPLIVVALSDSSRVDLEWILPLIDELIETGKRVEVFDFTPVDRDDRLSYAMKYLHHVLKRWPRRYADMEPIPSAIARFLDRLRASPHIAVARIGALYFSPKSLVVLSKWRARGRARALERCFRNCAGLFVGLRSEEWADGTGEAELIKAARAHGVPVIGFPPVADHEIPHQQLMSCDIALANTPAQADAWKKISDAHVLAVTPPAFTARWLARLEAIQRATLGNSHLPNGRKLALVILKNDNSIVWTGLDFHETARNMMVPLLDSGMHLLIKPHPRQTPAALQRLLGSIDRSRYTLIDGPLAYWAQQADLVVSLFSGGVLDCLAVGRVAVLYWPVTASYLEKVRSGDVTDIYVRSCHDGTLTTKYHDFCFEVTDPVFKLPPMTDTASRLAMFREHYAEVENCAAIRERIAC
ncbi:hypothetical protein JYT88_00855 [Rhodospirillaceae bacterium AH-315-P19]|nr:hypothetical protein [Rhodospirillaceae bacterium AH-315-P19]